MPRPLSHGPDAVRGDVIALMKCLDRVKSDPKRRGRKRERLIEHLKAAISLLVEDERTTELVRKIA